jgi:hypothetical protein
MRLTFLLLLLFVSHSSFGQSAGDYRSVLSGNWNAVSTWQRFNGSAWVAAITTPSSTDNVITIQSGDAVSIPAGLTVSADQLFLEGDLTIAATGRLNLLNGAGTDLTIVNGSSTLTVNGTFDRRNLSEITNAFSAANILFNSGSEYIHGYTTTFGDLPTATWDDQSTVNITGFTNTTAITADNSWDQTLGNLIFNSPGQRALVNFAGNIKTIKGDLTVNSTGNNIVQFSNAESITFSVGDENSAVGGDITIGGTSRVNFTQSGTMTINVYGDFLFNSTSINATYLNFTGTTEVNIYGDFQMAAGTGRLRFAGAGTTGNSTMNLYQDFSLISGRIDEIGTNPSQGNIRFIANGTQNFVNTGTIAGYFNYYVSANTVLDMGTSPAQGATPSAFVLDGGTVILGSLEPLGALHSGGIGNIRTPAAFRSYNTGSTIIYGGAGAQYMGSGQPTNTDITTTIDNPSGVSLITNRDIFGHLRLQNGNLALNGFTLGINGTVEAVNGAFAGSVISRLEIEGTLAGDMGDIEFDPAANTLSELTMNRTGANSSATITAAVEVIDQLNLTAGILINNSTLTLQDNALVTKYEAGEMQGTSPVSTGTYDLTYRTLSGSGGPYASIDPSAELTTNSNYLGNLTVSLAQVADQLTLDRDITVNETMTLQRGSFNQSTFDITMNGNNWNDYSGTYVPGTGTVIFNDSTDVNGSGTPLFGNIRLNTGNTLRLLRNVSIQGNITFLAGSSFNMSNFTVTLSGSNSQVANVNGATFSNITISKSGSSSVLLSSPMNVTGLIQFVGSTNINFQSNGNLTLVSATDNAGAGTASVYRLQNGNQVSGDVIAQRYMSGEGKIYRYISSPIVNGTVADLKDDFMVGGSFDDPSPTQTICGVRASSTTASLFWYDETVPGAISQGYTAYPTTGTAAGNPLTVGRGYAAYIRQCVDPTIIDYVGILNQGTLNLPVTYTVSDPAADGWNLVGNPYPATIDWDLSGWTKSRISTIIAITDNGSGITRYYDPGVVEEIPNGQIASGQGFWVRATAANPSLTIRETTKVSNNAEFFRERSPSIPSFVIALSDGKETDNAYVKTISTAIAAFDTLDAPKILNPNFSLSTISIDQKDLAINAIDAVACGSVFNLRTVGLVAGNYQLSVDPRQFFDDLDFVLIDNFTGLSTNIRNHVYSFSVTDEAASSSSDRFSIKVTEQVIDNNLTISAPLGACDKSNEITLNSTNAGVQYSIWADEKRLTETFEGTGDVLVLTLNSDSLSTGTNELLVKASGRCAGNIAVSSFSIIKSSPVTFALTGQFNCQKGSSTLKVTGGPNATYSWYDTKTSSTALAVGTEFETPVLSKDMTYYVEAQDIESGCVSDRQAITAEIVRMNEAPAIKVNGAILISNFDEGNQWYYNGNAVEGATNREFKMTAPGLYELKVNYKGCVSSASFILDDTAIPGIRVYPNPVVDRMTIEGIDEDVDQIELTTPIGQNLGTLYKKGEKFEREISLSSIPDGLYLLILTKAEQKYTYRIFKSAK